MSLGVGVLHNGEEVLWTGRPVRQAPIDWVDVVACLFLLYCLGFPIAYGITTPAAFTLAACLPAALFLIRKRSTAVTYVLTNQRVLTQSSKGVDAVPLSLLPAPVVIQQLSLIQDRQLRPAEHAGAGGGGGVSRAWRDTPADATGADPAGAEHRFGHPNRATRLNRLP